jgi:hypothetical protein
MRNRTGFPAWVAYVVIPVAVAALVCACAGTHMPRDGSLGSKLFYSRCRSCHAPVDPSSKTVGFWDEYLDRYAERAQLTAAERDSVMAFVVWAAQRADDEN